MDQKPPIAIPSSARPVISTKKFSANATMVPETMSSAVSAIGTIRRSSLPASTVMNRLVTTAKMPEIEIA